MLKMKRYPTDYKVFANNYFELQYTALRNLNQKAGFSETIGSLFFCFIHFRLWMV